MTNCPICGYPQYCGCESCSRRPAPYGFKRQYTVFTEKGMALFGCPNCHHVLSAEEWTELEIEEHKFLLKILSHLRPDTYSPKFMLNLWERIDLEKKYGDY